ncbi:unnamed protein product [Fraxinus pennsylvanica]|uniref:beta-N-acetylhexosaminidase n=1 Tax=Fraxinus pennsylvanica TaxID=56036 RepID=A0AAD2DZT5_9LAMI|nr:unnamed protein product [Fraxinus pennsylvanica]
MFSIADSHSFPIVLLSEPELVEFGMEYRVRVVPEIYMTAEPGTSQLNPLHPKTFQVVDNVVHDVTSMFPDQLYHAEAAEVISNCWKVDPLIQTFLSKNGTLSQILEMFVNTTIPYITSLNCTVVYWEDVLLDAEINVSPSLLPQRMLL